MEGVVKLKVPLVADLGFGPNWRDLVSVNLRSLHFGLQALSASAEPHQHSSPSAPAVVDNLDAAVDALNRVLQRRLRSRHLVRRKKALHVVPRFGRAKTPRGTHQDLTPTPASAASPPCPNGSCINLQAMSRVRIDLQAIAIWIAASWLRTLPEIVIQRTLFQRWILKLRQQPQCPLLKLRIGRGLIHLLQLVKERCIPIARGNNQRRLPKVRIN